MISAMSGESAPRLGRMEGRGYYTAHSEAQQAYGELGIEWLEQAAAEVEPAPAGLPYVIADFGAAGGGSSLAPMRRALAARQGGGEALVVHTDIPSDDFSALFELVDFSPQSYLKGQTGTFALAAGRSFYERLLPTGMLSLGWSSIAVHWLSALPASIEDQIYCSFAAGSTREALRDRAAADWRAFLADRAAELRPSGRLVVIGGASRDDGQSGAEGLMRAADAALRRLVETGLLEGEEYGRMTIPTWNRTLAEFARPFERGELADSLELRRSDLRWLPDPYFEAYEQDGDLDAYVEAVADFFRAAFEESLFSALDPGREPADREAVTAAFRSALRERIAADPEAAACRWHVALLDIARS
jgi:hypothetical protein